MKDLLGSILSQTVTAHETIVINDGSTDNTACIASQHGAKVVSARPLPLGWKGKPWACQQGADLATGDWLLFLDADVRLEKNALAHLQGAIAETDGKHVISVAPFHFVKKTYEELSAFFNLLMVAGANAFGVGKGSANNSALFGQCMLISKVHYQEVGGHEVVKQHILENFHLAENLKNIGIPRSCYLGKKMITMRMFPNGCADLWNSWKKGFSSGAAQAAPRALALSSIWISGAMFAAVGTIIALIPQHICLCCRDETFRYITLGVYTIYAVQCYSTFRKIGSFSLLNALLFPISLLFYQALFFTSLISRKLGKTTQWKGRLVN